MDEDERRELAELIAYNIRAELVCCDIYDKDSGTSRAGDTHPICFWGEAAARIALRATDPTTYTSMKAQYDALQRIDQEIAEGNFTRRRRPRRYTRKLMDIGGMAYEIAERDAELLRRLAKGPGSE